ncbi:MAG: NINE protein [Acholeplasmataceae bacterium]
MLLFIFLPSTHYFYVNKIGLGILFLITSGGFGLWWLIDLIRIFSGNFPDQSGKLIRL